MTRRAPRSESRWRRSVFLSRKIVLAVSIAALIVPAATAYAATNHRYNSGSIEITFNIYNLRTSDSTSGFNSREYNKAFRSPSCYEWRVRYYREDVLQGIVITWQVETICSPTEQGLTTGPRMSYCEELARPAPGNTMTFNCDTTVP